MAAEFSLPDASDQLDSYLAKLTFTRTLRSDLTHCPLVATLESSGPIPYGCSSCPSSYHFRYARAADRIPTPSALNLTRLGFQAAGSAIQFMLAEEKVTVFAGPVGVAAPPVQLEIWANLMKQTEPAGLRFLPPYRSMQS